MSQVIRLGSGLIPPGTFVETLTGNVGGPVGPDGAGNINTIGAGNIFVTGNAGTNTLTYTLVGTTNHSIQIGNAGGSLTSLPVAGNGQIPIGSVGADPVIANITAGSGIVVTNGPGSIALSTNGAVVVTTLHTQDGNNVTPTAGVININGAGGLATTGTVGPNTVTITAGGTIAQSFPTDAGTATPAAGVLQIITDNAANNAGATVLFNAPGPSNIVQFNVTDGLSNTLVGLNAGNLTLTGNLNTGLGSNVLSSLTTGSSNVGVGSSSLRVNTTGSFNVAMGVSSLVSNVSGSNNVALGIGALQNNVLFDNNTAVGSTTLQNYVGGVGTSGFNVALGVDALNALQTRNSNTAIGALAGEFLVSGIGCTLLGATTGTNLTASESYNVLIGASTSGLSLGVAGVNSLVAISTQNDNWFHNFGTSNIFVGKNAGNGTLTGTNSVAVGNLALNALTTGNFNTAVGNIAGSVLLTGTNNTLIGNSAGSNYVGAESSNILLGNTGTAAESNTIRIGTQGAGAGQQNRCFAAGIAGVAVANINMVTINTATGQLGSQAVAGAGVSSITGDTGGALTGALTFTGGTTGLVFNGAGTTETLAGTLVVANGGTGRTTLTNHGVLVGAGTSAITQLAVGTTGQVLTGVTGADPVFAAPAASSISITGDSGGALSGSAFTLTGGTTGLTFAGAGSTETLGGTLVIANGGTNATSMSTSTGIVKYDGTRLITSTTAKISSTNVMTNTAQPAFLAYLSADLTNKTGASVVYTVIFNTTSYDQASNFNTTTGTFTAPVTGIYNVGYTMYFSGVAVGNTIGNIRFVATSGTWESYYGNPGTYVSSNGLCIISNATNMKMTAGDVLNIAVFMNGATQTIGLSSNGGAPTGTRFYGSLIC